MAYDQKASESPEMDKKTAEEILGFGASCDYTQADMTERYHNTVADKVSSGAESDEMGRVDHAKAYLDSLFVEDPTVTLTSDAGHSASYSGGYASSGASDFPIIGSAIEAAADSLIKDESEFWPASLDYVYNLAHRSAARKAGLADDAVFDVPELRGDYPLWYQAVTKFVMRFPWRLLFAVIGAVLIADIWSDDVSGNMFDMLGSGMSMAFASIVIIVLVIVNCITGIFTNLVRRGLSWLFDKLLVLSITAICTRSLRRQIEKAGTLSDSTEIAQVTTDQAATSAGN